MSFSLAESPPASSRRSRRRAAPSGLALTIVDCGVDDGVVRPGEDQTLTVTVEASGTDLPIDGDIQWVNADGNGVEATFRFTRGTKQYTGRVPYQTIRNVWGTGEVAVGADFGSVPPAVETIVPLARPCGSLTVTRGDGGDGVVGGGRGIAADAALALGTGVASGLVTTAVLRRTGVGETLGVRR